MLILFSFISYELYITEYINLIQFFSLMFSLGWGLLFLFCIQQSLSYFCTSLPTTATGRNPICSKYISYLVHRPWEHPRLPLFHVSPSFKNCPATRCVTSANWICSEFCAFGRQIITIRFYIIISLFL